MRLTTMFGAVCALILFSSCNILNSDDNSSISTPERYEFSRNGSSTVSFSGQTTRILMAEELIAAMLDFENADAQLLLQMYRNETAAGQDADPFKNSALNNADKNLKGKVAASLDYFAGQAFISSEIRTDFEDWMQRQTEEVFPNENVLAEQGVAGQIADGSTTRYINAKGLEYDQMVTKGLLGALMTDQILNNYLSPAKLDAGTNLEDNDNKVLEEGENYTTMEHFWDEAYGYVYGTAPDPADPAATLGADDSFLNKYLGRLQGDEDFAGYPEEIFNAFALGRAAIVEGDYELRNRQAEIIQLRISEMIGIRAVFYLLTAQDILSQPSPELGVAFHDLSEAYGFIYSLQFTRKPGTAEPYFSKAQVDAYLNQLNEGNGLWDIDPEVLGTMAEEIAAAFDFTAEQTIN